MNAENSESLKKEENLILLTPGPSSKDYMFSMDKNDGVAEMFDISIEK